MNTKKKNIILSVTVIVLLIIVIAAVSVRGGKSYAVSDSGELTEFIASLGYTTAGEPAVKNIVIPAEFSSVYYGYNDIQKSAGYDLLAYRGESAEVYTYTITDYPDGKGGFLNDIKANIIVCDGKIIGGDISSAELDGFMTSLLPANESVGGN